MKKIILAGLIGLMPALLMAQNIAMNNSKSKVDATVAASITTNNANSNPAAKTTKAARKAEKENHQFTRTAKVFSHDFVNAPDVKWMFTKNEFVASFTKDDVHTLAWYGKGGALHYYMLTYSADKLPKREKQAIRSEYDDFKITQVDEVHQNDSVVYVVHLENERDIKLVIVCNGDINVYREYKKANF